MLNAFKQALTSTAKPVAIYVVINYTRGSFTKGLKLIKYRLFFTGAKAKEKQNRQSSCDRLKTFQLTEACFINMFKK